MIKYAKLVVFGFLLIPNFCYSQVNDSIPSNEHIEIMDDKLSIKIDNDIEIFTAEQSRIKFKIKLLAIPIIL